MAVKIKVGTKYVQFVTEDKLILTDDPEEAGLYSWEGQVEAERLIRRHIEDMDPEEPLWK